LWFQGGGVEMWIREILDKVIGYVNIPFMTVDFSEKRVHTCYPFIQSPRGPIRSTRPVAISTKPELGSSDGQNIGCNCLSNGKCHGVAPCVPFRIPSGN